MHCVLSLCCGTSHARPVIVVAAWWQWPPHCHCRRCLVVATSSTSLLCDGGQPCMSHHRRRCMVVTTPWSLLSLSLCGGGNDIDDVSSLHWPCMSHCHRCRHCCVVVATLSSSSSMCGGGHVIVTVTFIMAAWWQWPCRSLSSLRGGGYILVAIAIAFIVAAWWWPQRLVVVTPWHSPQSVSHHRRRVMCGRVMRHCCESWRCGTGHPCHVIVVVVVRR